MSGATSPADQGSQDHCQAPSSKLAERQLCRGSSLSLRSTPLYQPFTTSFHVHSAGGCGKLLDFPASSNLSIHVIVSGALISDFSPQLPTLLTISPSLPKIVQGLITPKSNFLSHNYQSACFPLESRMFIMVTTCGLRG